MMKLCSSLLLLFACVGANAQVVVHGNLSSLSGSEIITDFVNHREYLRFDEFNLTYADTLVAVAPGGLYEDWEIADRAVAEGFVRSLLGGVSACDGPGFQGECGTASGWHDGDFGNNSQSGQPSGYNDDIVAFLSDAGVYTLGSVAIRDDGVVFQQESWGNEDTLDFWGFVLPQRINLLLYRDFPSDIDSDGVPNSSDNCPWIANPDQEPSLIEAGRGVACEGLPPGC